MRDLRRFDLNLLVIFEAIYSAGNISRAGRMLGISQPTISNSLSRLRDSLDDPLFVASGNGVVPTQKALAMIGPVRDALHNIQAGVIEDAEFDPQTTKRHFRVLLLDQIEPIVMPHVLRSIQAYKSITIEALPISNTPIIEELNNGSLDLVLSAFVSDLREIACEALGLANVVVVSRKGHPEIAGKFTLKNFTSIGHVALIPRLRALSLVDETLKHQKIDRHIVYSVSKFWSFPSIIASTDLIALLPGDFAREAAKYYPLDVHAIPFEMLEQQFYMTWKVTKSNDPAHQWLRGQITDAYRETQNFTS